MTDQKIRIDVTEVAPWLAAELLSTGAVDTVIRCRDSQRFTVSAEFTTRKGAVDWLLRVVDVPITVEPAARRTPALAPEDWATR